MINEAINNKVNSILIFGAKDHIGSLVARYIHIKSPKIKLRVATHSKNNIPQLKKMFPYAETVVADFFDKQSLVNAMDGIEGVFQISPDVFNEDKLVDNMIYACERTGCIKHIIRILGTPPGATISLIPAELKKYRYYPAMQHLVATQRYQQSGLPVTFVNVAGYYMDDFIRMFSPPLLNERTIRIAFDKQLAWVDHADVAEVSAELLLSVLDDYKYKVLDITGNDLCKISDVARLFTEVLKVEVNYDSDEKRFFSAIKPVFSQLWGEDAPDYFMKYFKWETEHDHLFKLTPHVKNILGREPKLFKDWIDDNREFFLHEWSKDFAVL